MRIDDIVQLNSKCVGCMACLDACPIKCIHQVIHEDGFTYVSMKEEDCINCGKCYGVCPLENKKVNQVEQHLYAAYAKERKSRNSGSSGGVFEILAKYFLSKGYYVCGAAFDEKLQLRHRLVHSERELPPLLKSKYIQSDMKGVYSKVKELLLKGEYVFFCGTPCQVSALMNTIPENNRFNLLTADIICHGVPSQKMFDDYILSLEEKQKAVITDFSFRVKDNKYKHAHGYSYTMLKNGKLSMKTGIYTDSSFYDAFKNYLIFREGCYACQYATVDRVSDITLGDFWGIENYDFKGNTDAGVSMIVTNSEKGKQMLCAIQEELTIKEFPLAYGIASNHCFSHCTKKPKQYEAIMQMYTKKGYGAVAEKYFNHGKSMKHRIYWLIPATVRNLIRKIRGKLR